MYRCDKRKQHRIPHFSLCGRVSSLVWPPPLSRTKFSPSPSHDAPFAPVACIPASVFLEQPSVVVCGIRRAGGVRHWACLHAAHPDAHGLVSGQEGPCVWPHHRRVSLRFCLLSICNSVGSIIIQACGRPHRGGLLSLAIHSWESMMNPLLNFLVFRRPFVLFGQMIKDK